MAILATAQWWIRTDGNELNGGGYDATISGATTNYSDQASPQLSLTDVVTIGTTTVTSVTGGFTTAMIGNAIRIAGDGYYFVTARSNTNTITVDRATGTAVAQSARIGGAWAGFKNVSVGGDGTAPLLTNPAIAGNTLHVRGSGSSNPGTADYTNDGYYQMPDGDQTTGHFRVVGYNGVPCVTAAGHLTFYSLSYNNWDSVKFFETTGATRPEYGFVTGNSIATTVFSNCRFDQGGYNVSLINRGSSGSLHFINCIFENTGAPGAGSYEGIEVSSSQIHLDGCLIKDLLCSDAVSGSNGTLTMTNTVIARSGAGCGINFTSVNTINSLFLRNVTIDSCAADGLKITDAAGISGANIANCIFSNNGGYGLNASSGSATVNDALSGFIDYNNYYNNTSGARNHLSAGSHDTAVDPQYVSAATNNFTPQNATLKGAAVPVTLGTATNYLWIGAVQAASVVVAAFVRRLLFLGVS